MPGYPRRRRRSYRKKSYRKKRSNRQKRSWEKDAQYYGSTALQAYKMGKLAISMLNTEIKHHDTLNAGLAPSSGAWGQFILNAVPQGDTDKTRDGSKVRFKSLSLQGNIQVHASATCTRVKVVIVNTKAVGSGVITTDLYDAVAPDAFRNMDFTTKFEVMWSRIFLLDNKTKLEKNIKFFKKLSLPVNFVADSTTIENNQLQVVYCSDESVNTPTMEIYARMRYIDN